MEVLEKAKRTAKKITDAITGEQEQNADGILSAQPFYIDVTREREATKREKMQLEKIKYAILVYEECSNEKIETIEQFENILGKGPEAYYQQTRIEKNIEDKKPMTLQLLEEGFDTQSIADKIKLPDGFGNVVRAFNEVLKFKDTNWKNFTIEDGEVKLSDHFLSRLINRTQFFAITPLQKKRLRYAESLLKQFTEMEELLIEEARQAEIPEHKISKAIEKGQLHGPIPYPLRVNIKPLEGMNVKRELAINHEWVVFGFARSAGEIGLHSLQPQVALKKWEDPNIYLRFWRTDLDGARRPYIVTKDQKDKAYFGMWREAEIQFESREYKMIDGKLTAIS